MEDFAALEAELNEAAKAGNIDHVIALLRDVGNLHHLWKPNPAQVVAIDRATEKCLRKAGQMSVIKPHDLQNPDSSSEPALEEVGCERLIKGYMVSSVNEWGADQTRILLITNEAIHRVKYNFPTDAVVSWRTTPLHAILRVEYGSFRVAGSALTTFLFRKDIEDQQGFRIYTRDNGGEHRPTTAAAPAPAASPHKTPPPQAAADATPPTAPAAPASFGGSGDDDGESKGPGPSGEHFREYRALLAEHEPWKEEVFMLEVVAALQALRILTRSKFEVRLTRMPKSLPGGLLTLLHNAHRRRQHGF